MIIFVLLSMNSCELYSEGGTLYITDEIHKSAEIITVKILEHTNDESKEKNIFSDFKEIITFGSYSWYVYDIPEGTWDIYIEYYANSEFKNERECIYIEDGSSGNEWAAIWLVDNYDHSVYTEQGMGEINITSSLIY